MNDNSSFTKDHAHALYVSQPHDCSYLAGKTARTLFLDPTAEVRPELYQLLIDRGFRRSGGFLYQPTCPDCQSCVSLRIPAHEFQPNRSQRRNWLKNIARLSIRSLNADFSQEHFELYAKYQSTRHKESAMEYEDEGQYMKFLRCDWAETLFIELREQGQLLAVAVTDILPQGISSVYTFFDPERPKEGLGVFALLMQIELAKELDKPWVYPGFWIKESPKMNYKSAYRPLEAWTGTHWRRFSKGEELVL
jgi:arginine-tRNA-protein transferase